MGAASGPSTAEGLRLLLEGARLREEPDQARARLDRPIQQLGELVPGLALECEARALGKDALRLVDGSITYEVPERSIRGGSRPPDHVIDARGDPDVPTGRGGLGHEPNLHSGSVCYPSSSSTPSLLRKEWPPAPEG